MASKDVADNTIIELQPNWVGKLFGAYKRLTVDANSFYIEERSRKQIITCGTNLSQPDPLQSQPQQLAVTPKKHHVESKILDSKSCVLRLWRLIENHRVRAICSS